MTVALEHYPCPTCGKHTVHLRRGMNHAFHLVGALATVGIWCIGWALAALALDRTSYCVHCGSEVYADGVFAWSKGATREAPRQAEYQSDGPGGTA